jgi:hypothetical protein
MFTENVQKSAFAAAQYVSVLIGHLQGQPILKEILHNL